MLNHILTNAKGYAALLGSAITALLGLNVLGDTQVAHILTIVAAAATAFSTWVVPNLVTKVLDAAPAVPAAPAPVAPKV